MALPQIIYVSSEANEPTLWERFTEQSGVDISGYPIAISFGTDVEAATASEWFTPGSGNLITQSGTQTNRAGQTLHWLEASVLIGGTNYVPPTPSMPYVFARLGSNPATAIIRRGPQIIFR